MIISADLHYHHQGGVGCCCCESFTNQSLRRLINVCVSYTRLPLILQIIPF
uniref:Uncharacterized protein MANES_16G085900 n=1 Tax=Rhizophora mucronata TaxID=61149 RepID=A0A2P2J4U3_RHIMU